MARRSSKALAVLKATRFPLPLTWRENVVTTWRITAMLNKIPDIDYEATATAFERHHRDAGTLSDDWGREWRDWCRRVLFSRPRMAVEEISVGLFD